MCAGFVGFHSAVSYPGDISHTLKLHTRALLTRSGHSGLYHNPMLTVEAGPRHTPNRSFIQMQCIGTLCKQSSSQVTQNEQLVSFDLQSLEFKRILAEAVEYGDPFYIIYQHSPIAGRTDSGAMMSILWNGQHTNGFRCVYTGNQTVCPASEEQLIAPLHWTERIALGLLVSNPYPVVENSSSTDLHCFGP